MEIQALISPDAEIVELEPEGFARLSEILSHRVYATKHEIQILHESGTVVNVVDTREGVIEEYHESFKDAAERADKILSEAKVDRVVLIDKDRIASLQTELVELGKDTETQTELLWKAHEAFFANPAVAVAPALPPSVWAKIYENLSTLGDDYWMVLGGWKQDELFLSLIARVESGVVTVLTSADRLGKRPRRDEAMQLVEEVEKQGPVPVALLCDMGELERALQAEDPFRELVGSLDRSIFHRGVQEVLDV